MKRTYDDMNSDLTVLPKPDTNDPKLYKANIEGTHRLLVTKVVDISKPTEKPAEEIEPDENEEDNKQNKSSTRMLQLYMKDSNGTEIKAIETEFIDCLTPVKANHVICLAGPLEVRCGNIMLVKKNVTQVKQDVPQPAIREPEPQAASATEIQNNPPVGFKEPKEELPVAKTPPPPPLPCDDDLFSDDEPTQLYKPPPPPPVAPDVKQEVVHIEDWDEADEDDDDDCIILD